MTAQPVKVLKDSPCFTFFCNCHLEDTAILVGRKTLFAQPESSQVRGMGLQGSVSQGNCLISRFFHMLEVSTKKVTIRAGVKDYPMSHNEKKKESCYGMIYRNKTNIQSIPEILGKAF